MKIHYICGSKNLMNLIGVFFMSKKSIPLYIIILISFLWSQKVNALSSLLNENAELLSYLDSLIANHQVLVAEKEIRINGLRNSLSRVKSPTERLGLTHQLYDEYLVYDSDSALHYAIESRILAEQSVPHDYDLLTDWKLNEAFIFTVQGLYDAAKSLLETIDTEKLSKEMKIKYFGSLSYLYSMRSIYLNSNQKMWKDEVNKANEYRDSIQALKPEPDVEDLWIPIAKALDGGDENVASINITRLKEVVDCDSVASRQNAINSYWLSRYYEVVGDPSSMVKYKTKAAIYDAKIVNREIAALQELAGFLFENGELNRAYNYLLYAVSQANLYHNRYRMVSLSDVLPTVRDAYRIELEKRDKRLSLLVAILTLLSLVLLGSIVFIFIEFHKLKKMRNLLKNTNDELQESIAERDEAISGLETANSELNEANKQKLNLLAYAFKLTAQYINALEDYRKKLLRKYKVKRIDDLGVLINDPELIKEQYQGFYEGFDKTVLSIFPDFIEEYNATVSAENRVAPESVTKSKTLNTKLRIYALRRLGITKSADIAQILNVSIRTVYNNKVGGLSGEEEIQSTL